MTEKQIIDRLDSINLSLRQKKDLIDIIKDITASSGGGGNGGINKNTLDIYFDFDTGNITVNNKVYIGRDIGSNNLHLSIDNKELYDILYNFLTNTYRTIYLKTPPNQGNMIAIVTSIFIEDEYIHLFFPTSASMMEIQVFNK